MIKMSMKEYVDSRFKRIEDSINNYANGKDVDNIQLLENDITVEEINVKTKKLINNSVKKINPDYLLLDSNHRFVTDQEKAEAKEKISKTELNETKNSIINDTKMMINKRLDDIINDKDATEAINKLSKAIKENQNIVDMFKYLVDTEDLESHAKDGSHITEQDRIDLNLLSEFIDKGCADWNAVEGDANYVRNKPESMPANGGNSDTVGGYKPSDLFNKQIAKCIIGIDGNINGYTDKDVNIFLNKNTVNRLNNYLCPNSLTYIREGYYKISNFNMPVNSNISGVGISTQIDNSTVTVSNNSKLHDIYFTNSNIDIKCNESEITDVVFKNCIINLNASRCIIKNCRFINCTFDFENIQSSIIKDNICSGATNKLEFYGGNNKIDNLYV